MIAFLKRKKNFLLCVQLKIVCEKGISKTREKFIIIFSHLLKKVQQKSFDPKFNYLTTKREYDGN